MKKQKHILLVSNTAFSFWNFRRDVLQDMVSQGYRVTCMAAYDEQAEKLTQMGVQFIPIALSRSGMNPVAEMLTMVKIFRLLSSVKPDLVISYTIKPNSYIPVLSRMLGVPCLAVVTGLGFAFLKDSLAARLARAVLKLGLLAAQKIWFLNHDDMNLVTANSIVLKNKAAILPGEGIDTDFFDSKLFPPKPANQPFVFLMIGRALKDKGIIEFCEAAKIVQEKYPESAFWLLGGVDLGNPASLSEKELTDICQESGVIHHHSVTDVRPLVAMADICVLPSYREGVPMALLEAASMKLPLIATDVAGCRDVIEQGINGFIVPVKSAYHLANAMLKFLEMDKQSFDNMKNNSRKIAYERFGKQIIISQYRQLLKEYVE